MKLKEYAKSLKKTIPAVFLALKDKDTPMLAKVLAGKRKGVRPPYKFPICNRQLPVCCTVEQ